MVTIHTIRRLSQRIDALEEQLGAAVRLTYTVWLSFDGDDLETFYARYPDARDRRHQAVTLSFDNDTATPSTRPIGLG